MITLARSVRCHRGARLVGSILLSAPFLLVACDGDAPDPAGPDPDGPYEVTLESDVLDSGGTGVLVSTGFVGLQLDPAVDDENTIVPERWTNLAVTVDGNEANVRRLAADRMEFDVPAVSGGTHAVEVVSPQVHGSLPARFFGVIASERVVPCFLAHELVFIAVADALYFDNYCLYFDRTPTGLEQGIARILPQQPFGRFEWIPAGYPPEPPNKAFNTGPSARPNHFVARVPGPDSLPLDVRVWRVGVDPQPVASLNCLPAGFFNNSASSPAELGSGACLLLAPDAGVVFRNGEPVIECCRFSDHIVLSDDGWAAIRGGSELVVFDANGDVVFAEPFEGRINDVRFGPGGGSLYVARENFDAEDVLQVVDRQTGEVLRETAVEAPTALSITEDRLWVARGTRSNGGTFPLERYDPATLDLQRSLVVARDPFVAAGGPELGLWPYHGSIPILLEDATGRRLTFTGVPQDWAGAWSHVIEVE